MLVSSEGGAMTDAALRLVEASEEEGEDFPRLRAGVARGPALLRSGDYYGRAVNLASRITAIAKPGSVLVDPAAKRAAPDAFEYSFAGERRLKGVDSRIKLFRARHHGPGRG
jgi:adenylate cyclase